MLLGSVLHGEMSASFHFALTSLAPNSQLVSAPGASWNCKPTERWSCDLLRVSAAVCWRHPEPLVSVRVWVLSFS